MTYSVPSDISFDALVEAIKKLDLSQKGELFEILDDLLFDAEEATQNPGFLAEIAEARQAYEAGDYRTVQALLHNSLE